VLPGAYFRGANALTRRSSKVPRDHILDVFSQGMVKELVFAGLVDDQLVGLPD
jgi:hypothetical protein